MEQSKSKEQGARSKAEQEQQALRNFVNSLNRPTWRTTFGSPMTREDERESRRFVGTMLCVYTSRGDRFDTPEWSRSGKVELYRPGSAGRRAC